MDISCHIDWSRLNHVPQNFHLSIVKLFIPLNTLYDFVSDPSWKIHQCAQNTKWRSMLNLINLRLLSHASLFNSRQIKGPLTSSISISISICISGSRWRCCQGTPAPTGLNFLIFTHIFFLKSDCVGHWHSLLRVWYPTSWVCYSLRCIAAISTIVFHGRHT